MTSALGQVPLLESLTFNQTGPPIVPQRLPCLRVPHMLQSISWRSTRRGLIHKLWVAGTIKPASGNCHHGLQRGEK